MSKQVWYSIRWLILGLLTGGLLLQSACATSLATGTADLMISITNSFIGNLVNKAMGIETFPFSLGT